MKNLSGKESYRCNRIGGVRDRRLKGEGNRIPGARGECRERLQERYGSFSFFTSTGVMKK